MKKKKKTRNKKRWWKKQSYKMVEKINLTWRKLMRWVDFIVVASSTKIMATFNIFVAFYFLVFFFLFLGSCTTFQTVILTLEVGKRQRENWIFFFCIFFFILHTHNQMSKSWNRRFYITNCFTVITYPHYTSNLFDTELLFK